VGGIHGWYTWVVYMGGIHGWYTLVVYIGDIHGWYTLVIYMGGMHAAESSHPLIAKEDVGQGEGRKIRNWGISR
jgi:hypothetical protein